MAVSRRPRTPSGEIDTDVWERLRSEPSGRRSTRVPTGEAGKKHRPTSFCDFRGSCGTLKNLSFQPNRHDVQRLSLPDSNFLRKAGEHFNRRQGINAAMTSPQLIPPIETAPSDLLDVDVESWEPLSSKPISTKNQAAQVPACRP